MKIGGRHRKALEHMDRLEFEQAARTLKEMAADEDSSWIVMNDLALCRFALGDAGEAVELLDRVLQKEPENSFAKINRYYVAEADKIRNSPPPDPASRIREVRGKGPDSPRVSVIMPTYNRPDLIRESIESVISQTFTDWELIVVNDGGGREVEAAMEKYLKDPRVRYVFAEHGGTASAINAGLHLSRGSLLAYLDDDDIFYSHHLETLVHFLDKNPDAQAAHTLFYRSLQKRKQGSWETVTKKVVYGAEYSTASWRRGIQVPGRNPLMHRRSVTDEIGGASEWLCCCEDWEFYLRLLGAFDLHAVPEVTGEFIVREGAAQKTRQPKGPRNHSRNLIIYMNSIFPLTGLRFMQTGQGSGERLLKASSILGRENFSYLTSLELRKLIREPYYSIFHRLGKDIAQEGKNEEGKLVFRQGLKVAPFEPRLFFRSFF